MRKKITFSIMLILIGLLSLVGFLFSSSLYFSLKENTELDIKQIAYVFENNTADEILPIIKEREHFNLRVTLIKNDGTVFFDSLYNPETMENHKDRAEVVNALENGEGEGIRYSSTIGEDTYFYAVLLKDSNVLRIGKTIRSVTGLLLEMLPAFILIIAFTLVVGYFFAAWLTKKIVDPINEVEVNEITDSPYEELNPFIKTIVNQREAIERQVKEAVNRTNTIETMMNSMKEGLIIIDKKGTIISINDSAYTYFLANKAYIGSSIISLFRDLEFIENVKEALNGKRKEMDFFHKDKTFRIFFSPVENSGAIILFLDVTEKINAEKMRREFSANVTHELKTPLSSIMGNAELLREGIVKKEDEHSFYVKIFEEASRLITLIDDILLLSKLDEGKEISRERVDLKHCAIDVIDSLKTKADKKNIKIDLKSDDVSIIANSAQMYELFYNLIDNGIKYNKIGGNILVSISNAENGKIEIKVKDSGIGIAKKDQERIFERFYRVDKSRSKETGGTGLGLSIVKHIVLSYKGEIFLESEENVGTEIRIFIPSC